MSNRTGRSVCNLIADCNKVEKSNGFYTLLVLRLFYLVVLPLHKIIQLALSTSAHCQCLRYLSSTTIVLLSSPTTEKKMVSKVLHDGVCIGNTSSEFVVRAIVLALV